MKRYLAVTAIAAGLCAFFVVQADAGIGPKRNLTHRQEHPVDRLNELNRHPPSSYHVVIPTPAEVEEYLKVALHNHISAVRPEDEEVIREALSAGDDVFDDSQLVQFILKLAHAPRSQLTDVQSAKLELAVSFPSPENLAAFRKIVIDNLRAELSVSRVEIVEPLGMHEMSPVTVREAPEDGRRERGKPCAISRRCPNLDPDRIVLVLRAQRGEECMFSRIGLRPIDPLADALQDRKAHKITIDGQHRSLGNRDAGAFIAAKVNASILARLKRAAGHEIELRQQCYGNLAGRNELDEYLVRYHVALIDPQSSRGSIGTSGLNFPDVLALPGKQNYKLTSTRPEEDSTKTRSVE